jgi:hypothetical protein
MSRPGSDQANVYVLRIWRSEGGFRAAVRRVEDEQARFFDDVEALMGFLTAAPGRPNATFQPED